MTLFLTSCTNTACCVRWKAWLSRGTAARNCRHISVVLSEYFHLCSMRTLHYYGFLYKYINPCFCVGARFSIHCLNFYQLSIHKTKKAISCMILFYKKILQVYRTFMIKIIIKIGCLESWMVKVHLNCYATKPPRTALGCEGCYFGIVAKLGNYNFQVHHSMQMAKNHWERSGCKTVYLSAQNETFYYQILIHSVQ